MAVRPGIEVLLDDRRELITGKRVGLVAHAASVDRRLRSSADLLHDAEGVELAALFGPQHGLFGETQDNMIEWEGGFRHPRFGCPVYSLYGEHRVPPDAWLDGLDVLVVDLQDVGTRIYTYAATLWNCMSAAGSSGPQIVVADRPNPIGGVDLEGTVMEASQLSFVGPSAGVVFRHGMTMGELAGWFRERDDLDARLEVVPCAGWRREQWFDQTGLPWVLPSPNMPTLDTAAVFPGQVVLEGTRASEGRGTTRPFELVGHPEVSGRELCEALERESLPGVAFRQHDFMPTFQKWAGETCGGVQIHVTDRALFRPVRTGYAVLVHLRRLVGLPFWSEPPYEYVSDRPPVDVITGGSRWREAADAGASVGDFCATWEDEEASFEETRREYLLYEA